MAEWLQSYVPGPVATVAPPCHGSVARVPAEAIRSRPLVQYANALAELSRCERPEAAAYIERAILYVFASL